MEGKKPQKPLTKKNHFLNEDITINVTHSSVDSIPIRDGQRNILVKSINLGIFKTVECQKTNRHNHKRCPYFHSR